MGDLNAEKRILTLREVTQKLFRMIEQISEDLYETQAEQIDFCQLVAINLIGVITFSYTKDDGIAYYKNNSMSMMESIKEWFDKNLAFLEKQFNEPKNNEKCH